MKDKIPSGFSVVMPDLIKSVQDSHKKREQYLEDMERSNVIGKIDTAVNYGEDGVGLFLADRELEILLAYVESLETKVRQAEAQEMRREVNRKRERARRERETPEQAAERRRKNAERARARRLTKNETV